MRRDSSLARSAAGVSTSAKLRAIRQLNFAENIKASICTARSPQLEPRGGGLFRTRQTPSDSSFCFLVARRGAHLVCIDYSMSSRRKQKEKVNDVITSYKQS